MTLNTIITKPRTKRTAKVLLLRGAQSKYARKDNCRGLSRAWREQDDWACPRPRYMPGVAEQFDVDDLDTEVIYAKKWESGTPAVYTSETPPVQKPMLPEPRPETEYDDCGRRIVVINTDDAWQFVGGYRS